MLQANTTFLVNELWPDRYGVGRTKVYEYLKALDITPFKLEGDKRSHITLDQLEAIDHYAELLADSDPEAAQIYADSFNSAIATQTVNPSANAFTALIEPLDISPAIATLAQAIAQQIQPAAPPTDPLAPQRQLKEAASEGWVLSSGQVREILGLAGWSGAIALDSALSGLERLGRRVGGALWWKVLGKSKGVAPHSHL